MSSLGAIDDGKIRDVTDKQSFSWQLFFFFFPKFPHLSVSFSHYACKPWVYHSVFSHRLSHSHTALSLFFSYLSLILSMQISTQLISHSRLCQMMKNDLRKATKYHLSLLSVCIFVLFLCIVKHNDIIHHFCTQHTLPPLTEILSNSFMQENIITYLVSYERQCI